MAGTINTTNYGFKKYAPEDTVSMLQTFNGNMDGIDTAIKARQDENTVTAANVRKVEQGLTTVNEAINTTNNTVAAQNVQIQTNKQNITAQGIEIDSLDARVTALEDGGSEIVELVISSGSNVTGYYASIISQGDRISGTGSFDVNKGNGITLAAPWENWNGTNPYAGASKLGALFTISGNPFKLSENANTVVGSECVVVGSSPNDSTFSRALVAVYNGVNTTVYGYLHEVSKTWHTITIDYLAK